MKTLLVALRGSKSYPIGIEIDVKDFLYVLA